MSSRINSENSASSETELTTLPTKDWAVFDTVDFSLSKKLNIISPIYFMSVSEFKGLIHLVTHSLNHFYFSPFSNITFAKIPFTKDEESSVEYFLANSTASSQTTFNGAPLT